MDALNHIDRHEHPGIVGIGEHILFFIISRSVVILVVMAAQPTVVIVNPLDGGGEVVVAEFETLGDENFGRNRASGNETECQ